jgi:hypothetical protein
VKKVSLFLHDSVKERQPSPYCDIFCKRLIVDWNFWYPTSILREVYNIKKRESEVTLLIKAGFCGSSTLNQLLIFNERIWLAQLHIQQPTDAISKQFPI